MTVGIALEKLSVCEVRSMALTWWSPRPGMRKGGHRKFRTPYASYVLIVSYTGLRLFVALEDNWNAWSAAWPCATQLLLQRHPQREEFPSPQPSGG